MRISIIQGHKKKRSKRIFTISSEQDKYSSILLKKDLFLRPAVIILILLVVLSNDTFSGDFYLYFPSQKINEKINNNKISEYNSTENPIQTRIEIIDIGLIDIDSDRRYDFISEYIVDWKFHFKVVEAKPIFNGNNSVNVGYVWINLSFNNYSNNSMVYLNSSGDIILEFDSFPLNSTDGKQWTICYDRYWNITLTIDYPGFERYLPCSRILLGTLHGTPYYGDHRHYQNNHFRQIIFFSFGFF